MSRAYLPKLFRRVYLASSFTSVFMYLPELYRRGLPRIFFNRRILVFYPGFCDGDWLEEFLACCEPYTWVVFTASCCTFRLGCLGLFFQSFLEEFTSCLLLASYSCIYQSFTEEVYLVSSLIFVFSYFTQAFVMGIDSRHFWLVYRIHGWFLPLLVALLG